MRFLFSAALVAVSSALFACQDYRFEQRCPERISEQTLARSVAKPRPSDILFIVDDSGSMADEQERLATNFNAFISELAAIDHDYRIAVVTTDMTSATNFTGKRTYQHSDLTTYRHVYADDFSSCTRTNIAQACVRGPDMSTRIIDSTMMTPAQQVAAFIGNVQVGSCGDGQERGLEAMLTALGNVDSCNAGFGRADANLVLIFVSDEEDVSSDDVSTIVDRLEAIRPITDIRVAAVVGFDGTEAANCANGLGTCGSLCNEPPPPEGSGDVCTNGAGCAAELEYCDKRTGDVTGTCKSLALLSWSDTNCSSCSYFDVADCCTAQAGGRYVRFAREVESRIVAAGIGIDDHNCLPPEGERAACLLDSVCQDSFANTLQRIARDLVIPTDYDLVPPPPDPTAVTARLSGGRFGNGVALVMDTDFTINEAGTRLSLLPEKAPLEDETLDISYVVELVTSKDMPRGACGID